VRLLTGATYVARFLTSSFFCRGAKLAGIPSLEQNKSTLTSQISNMKSSVEVKAKRRCTRTVLSQRAEQHSQKKKAKAEFVNTRFCRNVEMQKFNKQNKRNSSAKLLSKHPQTRKRAKGEFTATTPMVD
jgi:hypothetical protein